MFRKFGAKIVDTTTGQIPAGALVAGPMNQDNPKSVQVFSGVWGSLNGFDMIFKFLNSELDCTFSPVK